ncbi:MAG: GNAT family N-acetyltransferase [Planctomycetota bacterium]
MIEFAIRSAERSDIPQVFAMVRELAVFEKLEDQLVGTESDLESAVFDANGPEVLVAERDGSLVGYAIFFHNFSTFLCRRGIYLEDLYVRPEHRGLGIGKSFLSHLARLASERRCGRMEWAVLDWNQRAIDVYESIGGEILPDWRIVRLGGAAIDELAERNHGRSAS